MVRDRRSRAGAEPSDEAAAAPASVGKRSLTERLVQRSTPSPARTPAPVAASSGARSPVVDPFDWAALSAPNVQLAGPGADDATVHAAAAQGVATPASSLPFLDTLTAAFGPEHELGGVRAHVGGAAEASAQAMGAQAYATGHDVVLPANPSLHLVAHEATHVVQQRAGVHLAGGVGAAGDAYEQEADRIADAVVRGERVGDRLSIGDGSSPAVQRQEADDARGSGTTASGGSTSMGQQVIGEPDDGASSGEAVADGERHDDDTVAASAAPGRRNSGVQARQASRSRTDRGHAAHDR